jgi:organic hydroperoxide reductase OsmC/OhrA
MARSALGEGEPRLGSASASGAASACRKLWYLHLAADAGIIVTAYADRAGGALEVEKDGVGQFKSVVLHPTVTVAPGSDIERARTPRSRRSGPV